jgi:hypothetical protein
LYVSIEQSFETLAFLPGRKLEQAIRRIAVGVVEPGGRNDTRSLKLSER